MQIELSTITFAVSRYVFRFGASIADLEYFIYFGLQNSTLQIGTAKDPI